MFSEYQLDIYVSVYKQKNLIHFVKSQEFELFYMLIEQIRNEIALIQNSTHTTLVNPDDLADNIIPSINQINLDIYANNYTSNDSYLFFNTTNNIYIDQLFIHSLETFPLLPR